MADLFTLEALFTLMMLIFLQAVLGFDNLLYISIESKRVAEDKQSFVRQWGIGLAIILRIILLFVVIYAIKAFGEIFASFDFGLIKADLTLHALIVFVGGVFIMYTAMKEIMHMLAVEDLSHGIDEGPKRSTAAAMFWIILMNLVFSFDSILSAIALTDNTVVISLAIIASGIMMIVLADRVSEFLKKNRMYEVLGLFILLLVGIMLISEGGHLAHVEVAGYKVEPLAKSTFYFVLAVMVVVDIVQSQYQKKLMAEKQRELARAAKAAV